MKKITALLIAMGCIQCAYAERLIIKYKTNGVQTNQQVAQKLTPLSTNAVNTLQSISKTKLQYSHPLAIANTHVLMLPENLGPVEIEAIITRLKQDNNIASVSKDVPMYTMATPNDTDFQALWGLQSLTKAQFGADFQKAWDTYTGKGVTVAVIDSGVVPHQDLGTLNINSPISTGQYISGGYDFISDCRVAADCPANTTGDTRRNAQPGGYDQGTWVDANDEAAAPSIFGGCRESDGSLPKSQWHGTHVAGTIAAKGNNGLGVIGGAYNAKILPVRVIGKCKGTLGDIINGIHWAVNSYAPIPNPNPAKVINMSLGGRGACNPFLQLAIDEANRKGAIVVVAAGNESEDANSHMPANCKGVIVVGNSNKQGSLSTLYRSNFGSIVTLMAPGESIYSTVNTGLRNPQANGDSYIYRNGTSMATPHVSAAIALLVEKYPTLTLAQAKAALRNGATRFPDTSCNTNICGKGILNAFGALNASLVEAPAPTPVPPPAPPVPPASQVQASDSGGGGGGGAFSVLAMFGLFGSMGLLRYFRPKFGSKN